LQGELERLSSEAGVTLYMTLLSAFKVLLYRYSGQTDISVGSPVANRTQAEVADLVGFFVNTIVVRTTLSGSASFLSLLEQVRGHTVDAYHYQYVPYEKVVAQHRHPLFQVMFSMQQDDVSSLQLGDALLEEIRMEEVWSKFELSLEVRRSGTLGGYQLTLTYQKGLYHEWRMKGLLRHYEVLLRNIVSDPGCSIDTLSLLSAGEDDLLKSYNGPSVSYPTTATLVSLFSQQVLAHGERVALSYGSRKMSYRELDAASSRLGHYLRSRGVCCGMLVGLCTVRSMEMVIGILGIQKAGGAYVPIDPFYPAERINYILSDTGCSHIVSDGSVEISGGYDIIDVHAEAAGSVEPVPGGPVSTDAAYVIYTSGSTGRPKGVVVEHGQVLNRLCWAIEYMGINHEDIQLHKTTYCFDVSVGELFIPLLAGAEMVIAGPDDHKDPEKISALIGLHAVTCIHFVPSMLETFLLSIPVGACTSLKHVVCSGEALKSGHVEQYQKKLGHATLYNLYGPTEAAIDVTCWKWDGFNIPASIPIGKPIANTQIYIVDNEFRLLPVGVVGQLCIGGIQVARGYLNRPELTADKFRSIKINGNIHARVYCTGDLASWQPDGNITFLGRRDDQVKIRGYRIELEEIENTVRLLPGIKQVAVIVRKDKQDNPMLIGYVVPEGDLQTKWLAGQLKKSLPDYMLPAVWIAVDNIPVTSNGKLDKNALPEGQPENLNNYEAAGDMTEHQLQQIWQELLTVERIGIRDDFFQLGGNSLILVILKNRIRKFFTVDIELKTLFSLTDIASQAAYIRNTILSVNAHIPLTSVAGNYPLSAAQQRIWALCQANKEGNIAYNMHAFYQVRGGLNLAALEKAFTLLIARHEILRTNFVETSEGARQVVNPAAAFVLVKGDVNTITDAADLYQQVMAQVTKPMDLEKEDLIKAILWCTGYHEYALLFQTHHIISDGWSLQLIVKELFSYYRSFCVGNIPMPVPLSLQFKDYACWQADHMRDGHLAAAAAYWRSQFVDEVPLLHLQGTFARPSKKSFKGKVHRIELSQHVLQQLHKCCQDEEVTLFMLMLAVLKTVLYKYTGQEDLVVGTPVSGRTHYDLEEQLGFYANTLPLRTTFNRSDSFHQLLQKVKMVTLKAVEYQDYPFSEIVNQVLHTSDASRSSLFDVMLIYGDEVQIQEQLQLDGLLVFPYPKAPDNETSKFDLSFIVQPRRDGLALGLEYSTDLFDSTFAARMLNHIIHILDQVVESTGISLSAITCYTQEEENWLNEQNNTAANYPPYAETVMDIFEAQVASSMSHVAMVDAAHQYTYQQLHEAINAYSTYLHQQFGVGKESVVAVMLPRSCWSAISILSIMKLGGVYVPLDPSLPAARLEYMLADAGAAVLITVAALVPDNTAAKIALLSDFDMQQWTGKNRSNLTDNHSAGYIIYTSGTTGVPKGVKQTYLTLYNLIRWNLHYGNSAHYAKHLQYASMGFDMALHDLFATLCAGGTLYIITEGQRKEIPSLVDYILEHQITSISMTYSTLQIIFADYSSSRFHGHHLRQVIAAGEQLFVTGGLRAFLQDNDDVILYNYYGPTETHVITAARYCFSEMEVPVKASIGRPIWNSSIYILNKDGQPAPPGIAGEIYLGGWNLAAGYQGSPEMTLQKFVPHVSSPGDRLYKTGDMGRWLADGNIDYLGRTDDQVKIRGYRVELDEITHVLCSHEGIAEAITLISDIEEPVILAYVVVREGISLTAADMDVFAADRLPYYMHPAVYIFLDHFPLNANGKINKLLLPPADLSQGLTHKSPVLSANSTEEQLLVLWEEVLAKKGIGTTHNFFESGGQSLKAALLSVKINKCFNCFIKVSAIYSHPTIREQAALVRQATIPRLPDIQPLESGSKYQVSPSQEMILTFNEFNPAAASVYNIPLSCYINTQLNTACLQQALQYLVERHEALRTSFVKENGKYFQVIKATPRVEVMSLTAAEDQQYVTMLHEQERELPFDLEVFPLFRFKLVQLAPEKFVLMTTFHHVIFDAWSAQLLMKELAEVYTAFCEKRAPQLPVLNIHYKDYTHWYLKMLEEGRFASSEDYWNRKLKEARFPMKLPVDFQQQKGYSGALMKTVLPAAQLYAMDAFCQQEQIGSFVYLMSCITLALGSWADTDDVMVGLPVAGRIHESLVDQVGFYVNMVPLYIDIREAPDFKTLCTNVETELLAALDHQEVPFTHIMDQMLTASEVPEQLFNVVVNMGNIDIQTPGLADEKQIRQLFNIGRANSENGIAFTKNQLTITLYIIDGDLHIYFSYQSKLFKPETIQLLYHHFQKIWEKMIQGGIMEIDNLKAAPLVGEKDYGDWMFDFNDK
jgi:amino acid adenylation domain-containing protein